MLWSLCTREAKGCTEAFQQPTCTAITLVRQLWNTSLAQLLSYTSPLLPTGSTALRTAHRTLAIASSTTLPIITPTKHNTGSPGTELHQHQHKWAGRTAYIQSLQLEKEHFFFRKQKAWAPASSMAPAHSLLPQIVVKYYDFIYMSDVISNTAKLSHSCWEQLAGPYGMTRLQARVATQAGHRSVFHLHHPTRQTCCPPLYPKVPTHCDAVTHKKGFQSALNTYRIVSMISWAASWCLSWNKANKQVFSEMTGVLCFRRLQKLQSCSCYRWQAHKGRSIWLPPEPLNQSKWDHYFGCLLNRTRNTHHKSLQGRAPKAHAVHVDAPCYEKKSYLGKMKVFYISCCSHHKKP